MKKYKNLQKIRTVKGTKDLFGDEILYHEFIFEKFKSLCKSFNFEQISTPILEHSEVFTRSLGLSSDIVSKEMYNFIDQGKDNLVLRPEGTASIARAVISNSLEQNNNHKYFYNGPMFRREKPQSGRLRQFHQVGLEFLGTMNFMNDLEVIIIAEKFLKIIGIRDKLKLQINSLGNLESRKLYSNELQKFLKKKKKSLSDRSKERLIDNPLRILDSKDSRDIEILPETPDIRNYFDKESRFFFENLIKSLDDLNIDYKLNRFLVRGLDYYNHTAFEYVTYEDKSQNTVLAGGRYDGLIKSLGGSELTGVGWAAGIERIVMQLENEIPEQAETICFFSSNETLNIEVFKIVNEIHLPKNFRINIINKGTLKKKFAKANKMKAFGCVIFGEDEWNLKKVIWKDFNTGNQVLVDLSDINNFLNKICLDK